MKQTFLQAYESMFPPPVEYDLAPYQITSNMDNMNTEKNGNWELTPIAHAEIASVEKVGEWMSKHGRNTTKMGKPMTDDEFNAHYGLPTHRRRGG